MYLSKILQTKTKIDETLKAMSKMNSNSKAYSKQKSKAYKLFATYNRQVDAYSKEGR